jgi:hypothetical protein
MLCSARTSNSCMARSLLCVVTHVLAIIECRSLPTAQRLARRMGALARRRFATSVPKCLLLGSVLMEGNWAIRVPSLLPWNRRRSNSRRRSRHDMKEEKTR